MCVCVCVSSLLRSILHVYMDLCCVQHEAACACVLPSVEVVENRIFISSMSVLILFVAAKMATSCEQLDYSLWIALNVRLSERHEEHLPISNTHSTMSCSQGTPNFLPDCISHHLVSSSVCLSNVHSTIAL